MAHILLASECEQTLTGLKTVLENSSHTTTIATFTGAEALIKAPTCRTTFDLVLIDVSCMELRLIEAVLKYLKRELPVPEPQFILGFSTRRREPRFQLMLERAGVSMSDWSKFDPLVEAVEAVLAERRELEAKGPCLAILHRLWNPGTACAPGEEIAAITLVSQTRRCQLHLSNRGKVMFDLLARNSHLGINSQQIADVTRSERFYVLDGFNGSCGRTLRCDISRAAVRVYIDRLRTEIARVAAELQLTISPTNVIQSLATTSRETLYRLRANVVWQHEQ